LTNLLPAGLHDFFHVLNVSNARNDTVDLYVPFNRSQKKKA